MSDGDLSYLDVESTSVRSGVLKAGAVALVGALVAVLSVVFYPNVFVYLIGLAFLLAGAGAAVGFGFVGRRRHVALGIAIAVVAAAVIAPLLLAGAERNGGAHWSVPYERSTDLFADHDRLLGANEQGIFALSLRDGSTLWEIGDLGPVSTYRVSTDGYVFAASGGQDRPRYAWISPDGKILWERDASDAASPATFARIAAVGSSGGIVVIVQCDSERTDSPPCDYSGVDADGATMWTTQGYAPPLLTASRQVLNVNLQPEELAEVALISLDDVKTGQSLRVVDPKTGRELHRIINDPHTFATGDVVINLSGKAEGDGLCVGHGWSVDGKIDWNADVPCFEPGSPLMDSWIYGAHDTEIDGISESFALDIRTGTWHDVGGLSWFNNNVDGRTGVPGPEIVVQRRAQELTGMDITTGDQLWKLTVPGPSIPGVEEYAGGTTILSSSGQGHNPFFPGEARKNASTVRVVDSASGTITAT